MHLRSAEKDSRSGNLSSGNTDSDQLGDSGLQSVVNYLRRTKEIVREVPYLGLLSFLLPRLRTVSLSKFSASFFDRLKQKYHL